MCRYVRLYGPVVVKAVLVGCALSVFLFFGSRVVSGSFDDVHGSCAGSHQLISGSSDPACYNAECMDHRRGGMGLIFTTVH